MIQEKIKGYSKQNIKESRSINLLKNILCDYIKTDGIKENDKTPNHDGYIEILDNEYCQINTIFVQVKTISDDKKKNAQTTSFKGFFDVL
ncbi:MAG: hypothetical protein ACFFCS_27600 [Candidatus Hodarchaeota archaeon]